MPWFMKKCLAFVVDVFSDTETLANLNFLLKWRRSWNLFTCWFVCYPRLIWRKIKNGIQFVDAKTTGEIFSKSDLGWNENAPALTNLGCHSRVSKTRLSTSRARFKNLAKTKNYFRPILLHSWIWFKPFFGNLKGKFTFC